MTVPGFNEWLFSAKSFAAAMIAFYIALSIDLDRPYWCIATVYIVSQPLAGAMRSKGVYRMCGTLVGATAAVAMVPNLADAPVLLTAALCLWLGVCLYFSLCDRSPRSYVFMLAGYTSSIIGFPSVDQPAQIITVALARVEEIGLGIACATVIGSIVFPRPVAPVLDARMSDHFAAARRWALAALSGKEEAEGPAARKAMAGAASEFNTLTAYLAYDTSQQYAVRKPIAVLDARLIYLLPVVSGVANRIAALRRAGGLTPEILGLVDRVTEFLRSGPQTPPETVRTLRRDLSAVPGEASDGWMAILKAALLARLAEFIDVVEDIRTLRRQVLSADPRLPALALPPGATPSTTRNRDHSMALLSAVAAALALSLVCAFWIATEWPDGAVAALMAAILCSFFATLDDPVPEILAFLGDVLVAFVLAAIYLFVFLPQLPDFTALVLVLAPFYLVLGAFIAIPATFLRALSITLNTTMMLTLSDTYNAAFASFINTALATAFGIAVAAGVTALVRSVGADVTARRLRRACRQDVARVAAQRGATDQSVFAALLLDRLADLTPRLAGADADMHVQHALRDIGVGLNIVGLTRDSAAQLPGVRDSIGETLDAVAAHYERPEPEPPAPALLTQIDRSIAVVAQAGAAPTRPLLMGLLGIRQGLFPNAPAPDRTRACLAGAAQ
ncbi:MAG: FUSC family protein [Acetobacteraceae bacterium]